MRPMSYLPRRIGILFDDFIGTVPEPRTPCGITVNRQSCGSVIGTQAQNSSSTSASETIMSDTFDPYHKWLGIRPEDQPADYYRLLGIAHFEENPDVIDHAADARMTHLRNFQTGKNGHQSQKLLNEVAAARVCLLDPQKRAVYDRQLREQLSAATASAAILLDEPPAVGGLHAQEPPTFEPHSNAPSSPVTFAQPTSGYITPSHAPSRRIDAKWIAVGAVAACVILLAVFGVAAIVLLSILGRDESVEVVQPRVMASDQPEETARVRARVTRTIEGPTDKLFTVAFSPDGQMVAAAGNDQKVWLWEVADGTPLFALDARSWIWSVAFTPNGRVVAASEGHRNTIQTWFLETGSPMQTFSAHQGKVRTIAFSPDGKRMASVSDDRTVRWWDMKTGRLEKTLGPMGSQCFGVAWFPDSELLATAGGEKELFVRIWDATSGTELRRLTGLKHTSWSVAVAADGKTVAAAGTSHHVSVWNVERPDDVKELKGHEDKNWCVTFMPQSQCLVSCGDDATIRFWDPVTGRVLAKVTDDAPVRCIAFTSDGKTMATAGDAGVVKLWAVQID